MNWLFYAVLAVIFSSTREIFQKRALQGEKTLEYLVLRGFFISLLSLFLIPFVNFGLSWQVYFLCFITACLIATAIFYRNRALKYIEVSHVQPLMNLLPLFVLIIAFLFLGEKVNTIQFFGILLVVAGTYVLEIDHDHHGIFGPFRHLMESKHALMVIFAVFIFAISNTLDRFNLINYVDVISYTFFIWLMAGLIFFIIHYIEFGFGNLEGVLKKQWKRILPPAAMTLLLFFSFYKAMSLAPAASLVAAVFRLESVVATIEAGLFFHENHLPKKLLACTIMVGGAALVIL